ncbi:hypothetical protein MKW98_019108 [Papaver atlanticum]|uniref:RRM domain-containing protein n=1 Tax=Papaver atlanticum TaxID=357466 RepID=A0AAD4TKR8_9MAGN|nr:hypothetical protein MKW98_019108 [Papaver atlanticum]
MGNTSKISDVLTASPVVKSGNKSGGNKRDAEEEIETKLNLKKEKFQAENRDEEDDERRNSFTPPMKTTGASKTLIANNLPFSIDKSHVIDFFKQAGDIVDVRLSYFENGNSMHRGHIEFATEQAANKAVKFGNQFFLGRRVTLRLQLEGTGASQTLLAKNLQSYTDKSDVIKFFKEAGEIVDVRFSYDKDGKFNRSALIEFSTEEAAKKAVKLSGLDLLGCQVELRRQAEGTPGASKTICVKNLPFSIDRFDVINLFKVDGHIADVRFLYDEDGTFRRIVYVEFETEEAAKEALKLDGNNLSGRLLQLGIVRETLYIKGLDTSSGIDEIKSSLRKHFKTCGFIVYMEIETDDTGAPRGTALTEFPSLQAFHRALALNGQKLGDSTLRIEDYVPLFLTKRGTGARNRVGKGCLGYYSDTGYEHVIRSHRGYGGAGLGRHYKPTAGNKIKFVDVELKGIKQGVSA